MNAVIQFLKRNRSTVLAFAGAVGTVVTAVLAADGHVKAVDICRQAEAKSETQEPIELKDRVKKTWKYYIPATISGSVTIACILCGNSISQAELAGLAATAGYLARNRDKIKDKLVEFADKVKGELPQPEESDEDKPDILREVYRLPLHEKYPIAEYTGLGDTKFIEAYSGRVFYSSINEVNAALDEFNKQYTEGNPMCLSDLYDLLHIRSTTFGYQFGWPADPTYFDGPIHFSMFNARDENDEDLIVIDFLDYPMEGWDEIHAM